LKAYENNKNMNMIFFPKTTYPERALGFLKVIDHVKYKLERGKCRTWNSGG
jgi:hypothetical protein